MRGGTTALAIAALLVASRVAPTFVLVGCDGSEPTAPSVAREPTPSASTSRSASLDSSTSDAVNVLLITLDTTRADALGAYGQSLPATPRLDRLAAEGAVFLNALTSSPSTLPSHASLLTGKHPYSHGVRSNSGYVFAEENLSLAEVLKERGYRTGAEIAAVVLGKRTHLDQGFDSYRDVNAPEAKRKRIDIDRAGGTEVVVLRERAADDITRHGIDFLRANRGRSFFLWLHYFDPHRFFAAPEPFRTRLAESPYHAELGFVDHAVGGIFDELDRLGLADRTFVVVTSDHGEGLGEHGEESHSAYLYDTTMRIPLIVRGPGIAPARIEALVRSVDVAPTLLDLLGLPPFEDADGVSLRPLLEGRSESLDLVGYGESAEMLALFGDPMLRFVREGRWKYIHKARPELYDVEADPAELDDRSTREPERVASLRSRLSELLEASSGAPADASVALDPETRAQLQQLGYVGGGAPRSLDEELATLDVDGVDPRERTDDFERWSRGIAHYAAGDYEAAVSELRPLREENPRSAIILDMLVRALLRMDRDAEAIPLLRSLIELDPVPLENHFSLARLSRASGDLDGAAAALAGAIEVQPCSVSAIATLADLRRQRGDRRGQALALSDGVTRCPDEPALRNQLAWALATSPDAQVRDGARAVSLARSLVEASGGANPAYLDTLAAAHAETGDLDAAVRLARDAIARFDARGQQGEMPVEYSEHLALFESGQPLREE
jgi:choline-sulfatase